MGEKTGGDEPPDLKESGFIKEQEKKDATYNIIDLENRYSPGDKGPFLFLWIIMKKILVGYSLLK